MATRIIFELIMLVLFVLAMGGTRLPQSAHEIIGTICLLEVIKHMEWNWGWLKSFGRGRWHLHRIVNTVINLGLGISFVIAIVTGIFGSQVLFRDIIPRAMARGAWVHDYHVTSVYYLLIFVGLHFGWHWHNWWNRLSHWRGWATDGRNWTKIGGAVGFVLLCLGFVGYVQNDMGHRLLGQHVFMTPAVDAALPIFFLYLIGLLGAFAVVGWLLERFTAKE